MFGEEDLLPLSGIQHLVFCERQWGLIHIERQWEENRLTAEGRVLHERAHEAGTDARPGIVTARAVRLRSLRLGLSGEADVVEFHQVDCESPAAAALAGRGGWWRPFPVEYKRGRPKTNVCDEVQLCAQALCLEEMMGVSINCGALFYGTNRRRTEIRFDGGLRAHTEGLAARMHELYAQGVTPQGAYAKKCDSCSLYERCQPRTSGRPGAVARYLARALRE